LPVIRAEGLVLKVHPLGDADKIVTFLTREEGKIRGVAKSARRSRRRFGSSLEPWSRVSLAFFEKEAAELGRVDACDLVESAYRLHENLETACLLAYMAEVADLFSRDRQPEPHFYRLLISLLEALKEGVPWRTVQRYFELWTLKLHGLLPDLSRCGGCEATLSSQTLILDAPSGSVLCRRCSGSRPATSVTLSREGRQALATMLRVHPSELAGRDLSAGGLAQLGGLTSSLLASFVGAPFRSARFLGAEAEPA